MRRAAAIAGLCACLGLSPTLGAEDCRDGDASCKAPERGVAEAARHDEEDVAETAMLQLHRRTTPKSQADASLTMPWQNNGIGGLAASPLPLHSHEPTEAEIEMLTQFRDGMIPDKHGSSGRLDFWPFSHDDVEIGEDNEVNVHLPNIGQMYGVKVSDTVEAFRGIQYAEVHSRFGRPVLKQHYGRDKVDATKFGKACIQSPAFLPGCTNAPSTSEDCLNLNIYRPAGTTNTSNLPVYFWIHGGGATLGCGADYNGSEYATRENIIVVTINYRLGPLGWTASEHLHEENKAAGFGNSHGGLNLVLDAMEAVKWVRMFSPHFGGDPNQITVGGESNGGNMGCTLLHSPLTVGLGIKSFDLQSMGCNGPWGWPDLKLGLAATDSCLRYTAALNFQVLRSVTPASVIQTACSGYPTIDNHVITDDPRKEDTQIPVIGARVLLSVNDRDGLSTAPPFAGLIDLFQKNKSFFSITNLWFLEHGKLASDGETALEQFISEGNMKIKATWVSRFLGFGKEAAKEIVQKYLSVTLPENTKPAFDNHTRIFWRMQRDIQNLCPSVWLAEKVAASGGTAHGLFYWMPEGSSQEGDCSGTPTAHGCDLPRRWGTSGPVVGNFVSTVGAFVKGKSTLPVMARPTMDYMQLSTTMDAKTGFGLETCDFWREFINRGVAERDAFYAFR